MRRAGRWVAVDVGNSRMKWGIFAAESRESRVESREPEGTRGKAAEASTTLRKVSLALDEPREWTEVIEELGLGGGASSTWAVASVNPAASERFVEWLRAQELGEVTVLGRAADLPLEVALDEPDKVGIDRLLAAVAVNGLRPANRPAVIVDAGSAITVDGVSGRGEFLGGAIAPGIRLGARALDEFTAVLPLVEVSEAVEPVGRDTRAAMKSGLYWGAVGAVKELVRRVGEAVETEPVVFLTGGDAGLIAPHVGENWRLEPDLTLWGIYLSARVQAGHVE